MEMSGEQVVPASRQEVWNALNNPEVLKACVPGAESIEPAGDNIYQVLMVARVGPVSAKFKGKLTLSDIKPPESYSMAFEGQGGAAGFAKGGAQVRLNEINNHETKLSYDVKASVGGKLAQIGSRLIDAAAKKVADDFFKAFKEKFSSKEKPGGEHDAAHAGEHGAEEHHPGPVPRDPDLPAVSNMTLGLFAAGALVAFAIALFVLFG